MRTLLFTIYIGICFQALHWNNAFASKANVLDKVCYGLGLRNYVRSVVIEVGATATRLLYYGFITSKDGKSFKIDKEVMKEVNVNLTGHVNAIPEPSQWLHPLFLELNNLVAQKERSNTILTFVGASDLFSLESNNAKKSTSIFSELSAYASQFEYNVMSKANMILSEKDEALLLWFALNLILGRISGPAKNTAVALHLGKMSTEVAFEPILHTNLPCIDLSVFGQKHHIYSNSYSGLGFNEMRYKIFLGESTASGNSFTTQCMYADYGANWNYKGVDYKIKGPKDGPVRLVESFKSYITHIVNFTNCENIIKTLVSKYETAPCSKGLKIYALAEFAERMTAAKLINEKNREIKLQDVYKAAKDTCDMFNSDYPFLCMDLIYAHTFFRHVLNVEENAVINVSNKIKGVNVHWGLTIAYLNLKNFVKEK